MENQLSSNDLQTPIHRPPPKNLKLKAAIVVAIAIVIVAWGIIHRTSEKSALVALTRDTSVPNVKVIHPQTNQEAQSLVLPGTLQAFYSATVYARVSGYLKSWSVDIGAPVKAGQQLAYIETPELDQQLKQSEANLNTALANEKLTDITNRRWQHLLLSDSVSQQEADEKSGDFQAKQALVAAARADVDRLRALEAFKTIVAPFDGIVTARKTDIGALINAGHEAGHQLFTVDDVHKLRLYVSVPQNYANQIQVGMKAQLTVPEWPGRVFNAVLSDNSRSVGETSGTILVELAIDNADGKLIPGEYGNVRFDLPRDPNTIQLPASALVFRKDGLSIATLTSDNRVAYRSIQISHDMGNVVEVSSGVSASDRVIDSPEDSLEDGDKVKVINDSNQSAKGRKP